MNEPNNLGRNPVHLGQRGAASVEPDFTGAMDWYDGYGSRHSGDGLDGRLVTLHSFDGAWDVWEMHPAGAEVVVCTEGTIELVQEIDEGQAVVRLSPGEYVINDPGVWHSANDTGACAALFITAGAGTEHRPRN